MSRRIRRDDGEIYPSVTAAARALDPSGKKLQSLIGSISSAASGVYGRRTVYGYRYEYIDGEHARVSELAMAVAALSMAVSDLARALKVDGADAERLEAQLGRCHEHLKRVCKEVG